MVGNNLKLAPVIFRYISAMFTPPKWHVYYPRKS